MISIMDGGPQFLINNTYGNPEHGICVPCKVLVVIPF